MSWVLKNIGIQLWLALLVFIPVVFSAMPVIIDIFPGLNPVGTGFVILMATVAPLSWLMNFMGIKSIKNLVRDAQSWEMSAITIKAEQNYIRALRIYNSFLIWPFSAKKITALLYRAIAGFSLNAETCNPEFAVIPALYLKMFPQDEEIAELWLSRLRRSSVVSLLDQQVLSILASANYDNEALLPAMTEIFLALDRQDFTARRLYRRIIKNPDHAKQYRAKIRKVTGYTHDDLQGSKIIFSHPEHKPGKKIKPGYVPDILKSLIKYLWAPVKLLTEFLVSAAGRIKDAAIYIKNHEKPRFYVKSGFICVMALVAAAFIVNTLSYMVKTKTAQKEKTRIEIKIPKPFTIQVAAYLKKKYADRYVELLKKKDIKARVKKVKGGGKTWFVVQVSEFSDKKSAAAYGRRLKAAKIIDDFFVNNN